MTEDEFAAALALIDEGTGQQPIARVIDTALNIAKSPIACMFVRFEGYSLMLGARGMPLMRLMVPLPHPPGGPGMTLSSVEVIEDARDSAWRDHPIVTEHQARWLAYACLPLPMLETPVVLLCADRRQSAGGRFEVGERLRRLAAIAADEFQMLGLLAKQYGFGEKSAAVVNDGDGANAWPAAAVTRVDDAAVVSDFLFDTLVTRHRVRARNDSVYHSVASWRQSVKSVQLAALRALKRTLTDQFVDRVASVMAPVASRLFHDVPTSIVAVPCGHSGPGCLAERLARRLGERLRIPFVDAFEPLVQRGSSHPKTNARRPAMKLVNVPPGPTLLIDDVATSGAHLDEAAAMLRDRGISTFSLVWIAG